MKTSDGMFCLTKLPLESPNGKCHRFIQNCIGKENISYGKLKMSSSMNSEPANLTLAYIQLIFSKKSDEQKKLYPQWKVSEDLEATEITEEDAIQSSGNNSNAHKHVEKLNGKQQSRTTRKRTSDNVVSEQKVKLLLEKFRDDSDWDKNVIELNQLLSRSSDAHQKVLSVSNRKDVSLKLKHLISQLVSETELDSSENSTATKNKNIQKRKNVKESIESVPSSKRKCVTNPKGTLDDRAQRKSPRLSSHPPGHFQTKPAMILYMEPASCYKGNAKARKSTSAISHKAQRNVSPILRHSLRNVKRRKLYNPNDGAA